MLSTIIVATMMAAGAVGLSGHYLAAAVSAAPPEKVLEGDARGLYIVDRTGESLFGFAAPDGGFRQPVPLSEVSRHLVFATIATEDAEFWEHDGVNFKGLWRAVYENLAFWEFGALMEGTGGSSLTQQLARNLYFSAEERVRRDFHRKFKEAILAVQLERQYTKEEILERYFNVVFYGNSAYGVEMAARRYFNKRSRELNLAEAAMLAGLPKAPSEFDPTRNLEAARARQKQVLERMVERGYITQELAAQTADEPLNFVSGDFKIRAPHYVMAVRDLLPALIGEQAANQGGLKVTTSLDPKIQAIAEEVVSSHMRGLEESVGAWNAALVAIDPATGHVLAMVGSADYFEGTIKGEVNNATALQQPGSSIKPLVYLGAFMRGWSPSTIVDDGPLGLNDRGRTYVLTNADNKYRGKISVRQALGNSLNPPAILALRQAGLPFAVDLAGRMGLKDVNDLDNYGQSFGVGGLDTRLVDLVFAYSVLANYGEQHGVRPTAAQGIGPRPLEPALIVKVQDARGRILYEATTDTERIVPAPHAYLVTHVLSDNGARAQMFGTNSPLVLRGRPAAVKTGLSDAYKDAWTVGYTPQLVAGVWVGNDDNASLAQGTLSSRTAAPIWNEFMMRALEGKPALNFDPPPGVSIVPVCAVTGMLPVPGCPTVTEVFVSGQEPRRTVPMPAQQRPSSSGAATDGGADSVPAPAPAPAPPAPAPAPAPPAPAPAPALPAPAPAPAPPAPAPAPAPRSRTR